MNLESPPIQAGLARADSFLSEEDLDLIHLTDQELEAWWNTWLEAAQVTNEEDQFEYSHGVFRRAPK